MLMLSGSKSKGLAFLGFVMKDAHVRIIIVEDKQNRDYPIIVPNV